MPAARYELRDVHFGYGPGKEVLRGITLDLAAPELIALVGPNGAGKSTLLNVLAGLRDSYAGSCRLDGAELRRWGRRPLARKVSFVPQSLNLEFPFTAEQVVLMGRTPYADGLFETEEDLAAVERALALTDTVDFRARDFRTLSGGERQRVVLASALAQNPQVLLLDEPTTFLDLQHQLSLYRLLGQLCAESGILIVAATHDLNLAATFCDRVVVLRDGAVVSDAAPGQALSPEHIASVFGVQAEVGVRPDGRPWVFYGR